MMALQDACGATPNSMVDSATYIVRYTVCSHLLRAIHPFCIAVKNGIDHLLLDPELYQRLSCNLVPIAGDGRTLRSWTRRGPEYNTLISKCFYHWPHYSTGRLNHGEDLERTTLTIHLDSSLPFPLLFRITYLGDLNRGCGRCGRIP